MPCLYNPLLLSLFFLLILIQITRNIKIQTRIQTGNLLIQTHLVNHPSTNNINMPCASCGMNTFAPVNSRGDCPGCGFPAPLSSFGLGSLAPSGTYPPSGGHLNSSGYPNSSGPTSYGRPSIPGAGQEGWTDAQIYDWIPRPAGRGWQRR